MQLNPIANAKGPLCGQTKKGTKFTPGFILEMVLAFAFGYGLVFGLEYISVIPQLLPAEVRYFYPDLPLVPAEQTFSCFSIWYNAYPFTVGIILALSWGILMGPAPKFEPEAAP
jgi:hypothetical protein